MIYIFWSSKDQPEAKTIITNLLHQRLIACGSILPQVLSLYRWESVLEESLECKVILKTQEKHFQEIVSYIQKNGSYLVPEIAQVPVTQVNPDYLSWLIKETNQEII